MKIIIEIKTLPNTKKLLYSADICGTEPPTPEDMAMVEIIHRHIEKAFEEISVTLAGSTSFTAIAATTQTGIDAANKIHADAEQRESEFKGVIYPFKHLRPHG